MKRHNHSFLHQEHGGNVFYYSKVLGIPLTKIIDLSSSVNPILKSYLKEKNFNLWDYLEFYPDTEGEELKETLSQIYSLEKENFLLGNGSFELWQYFLMFLLPKGCKVFIPEPTFIGYRKILTNRKDVEIINPLSLNPEDHLSFLEDFLKKKSKSKVVILCHPNNPTGLPYAKENLITFLAKNPDTLFLIDEAFIDFIERESLLSEVSQFSHLYVFRSFTKFYGLAGLRIGFLVGNKKILNKLKTILPTWNTNTLSQILAKDLLLDEQFKKQSLEFFLKQKKIFETGLRALEVFYFPSVTNFYLMEVRRGGSFSRWLLKEKKILVRNCFNFVGLSEDYIRVSLKWDEANQRFLEALEEWLKVF